MLRVLALNPSCLLAEGFFYFPPLVLYLKPKLKSAIYKKIFPAKWKSCNLSI